MMIKVLFFIISIFLIAGCHSSKTDLKSPCVAIESEDAASVNPCVRRPVNKWLG